MTTANNNYGFDSDFRLYSVLGPFMRPAIIRDVVDTSKMSRSVQTSRFPGVLTIHNKDTAVANLAKNLKQGNLIYSGLLTTTASISATVLTVTPGITSASLGLVAADLTQPNTEAILISAATAPTLTSWAVTRAAAAAFAAGNTLANAFGTGPKSCMAGATAAAALASNSIFTLTQPGAADADTALTAVANAFSSSPYLPAANSIVYCLSADAVTRATAALAAAQARQTSAYLNVGDYIMSSPTAGANTAADTGRFATAIARGEVMQVLSTDSATQITVMRGVLGTKQVATIARDWLFKLDIPPMEDRNNNGLYSLAPITGTTFATAATRTTQYHTYGETDRILSFCNPMQGDLNNAPGSAIMSAITDDPVSNYYLTPQTATQVDTDLAIVAVAGNNMAVNGAVASDATTLTVQAAAATIALVAGDFIMISDTAANAILTNTEIMQVTEVTSDTVIKIARGQFGTTPAAIAHNHLILRITTGMIRPTAAAPGSTVNGHKSTASVVNSYFTRSSFLDTLYASSNGKEETAPSMWTVPRRHHLCRKLITGNPEVANADVAEDLYVIANRGASLLNSQSFARSRYTESIQANTVLNQDPSPNMRAMVTFVEPTKIAVSTSCTNICEYPAASFDFAEVDKLTCASVPVTIKGNTWSVVLPPLSALPAGWTFAVTATKYANYTASSWASTLDILPGVANSTTGLNNYNTGMFIGDYISITVPANNSVAFTILQTPVREGNLTGIDTTLNSGRTCSAGFDARLIVVGSALTTGCDCESDCGQNQAKCTTKRGGTWNTVNLIDTTCRASGGGGGGGSQPDLPPWLELQVAEWLHPDCFEERSMIELFRELQHDPNLYRSGGLGGLRSPGIGMWVCIADHPCLATVNATPSDRMCYVNLHTPLPAGASGGSCSCGGLWAAGASSGSGCSCRGTSFVPWGLNSQLQLCTGSSNSRRIAPVPASGRDWSSPAALRIAGQASVSAKSRGAIQDEIDGFDADIAALDEMMSSFEDGETKALLQGKVDELVNKRRLLEAIIGASGRAKTR